MWIWNKQCCWSGGLNLSGSFWKTILSSLTLAHSHSHSHSLSLSLPLSHPLPPSHSIKSYGKISSSEDFKNVQIQLKSSNVQNSLKCNCTLFFLWPPGEAGFDGVHMRPRPQMCFFGRPVFFSSLQCTPSCLATLPWCSQWKWVRECLMVDADPWERTQNILGFGATSSSSLREDNFTNRRPLPALPSHQQKQRLECSLHKTYVSLSLLFLLVVHICLFSWLNKFTQYTDGKY